MRGASVAADTRGRIEAAALRLFASRGVDGTSIRDIAQAVGVTEGALYRHFASKEAFARALFLDRYGALARGVEAARASHRGFDARLDALVAFFADTFDDDPDGFAYVLIAQHEHLRALDEAAPENVAAALVRVFEEAIAAGEIPSGDPALAAAMALGLVVQPAIFHIYGRLNQAPSAYRSEIAGAIRRAVGRVS